MSVKAAGTGITSGTNKAKVISKEDAFMYFGNEKEPLYLEADVSGMGLGAGLLQIGEGTHCS